MNRNFWKANWPMAVLLVAGFLVRFGFALPGLLDHPEQCFSRPDTPGYLEPARSLAAGEGYTINGEPAMDRVPGFPLFAAIFLRLFGSESGIPALVIALIAVGTLTAIPVRWAGAIWFNRRVGTVAAALYLFNPTAIANAPMLLSDTLFALFAALQLAFFGLFRRRKSLEWLLAAFGCAAIGALIRPINSVWLLPGLFLVAITPQLEWRKRLSYGFAAGTLFLLILLPWQCRNARFGGGYVLDGNTGAMYHQNGAMLLAKVNGTDFEEEKRKILAELETEFADREKYPDLASRTDYRLRRFRELILAHPLAWFPQHLRPHILLPDVPTLLENCGVTSANRGTLSVLQRDGIFAAVKHYFGGKLRLLLPLLPLLAVTGVTYLAALTTLLIYLRYWRKCYYYLFVFLAFVEYYFFLPGPITVPRYQLPALPFLTLLAAAVLVPCAERWFHRPENLNGGETFASVTEPRP